MQEGVVIQRHTVGIRLDEIDPLVLQEAVVVAVLHPAVGGGSGQGQIAVGDAHDRLAPL